MKLFRIFLLVIIAALCTTSAEAKSKRQKSNEPVPTTIYAFGVAQNLSDSTLYITSISAVNGAMLMPHHTLQLRQYYSEQLKKYVEETYGQNHQTVAFFFDVNRKKMEKKYLKVQSKAQKNVLHNVTIQTIPAEAFRFKVPVLVESDGEF